MVKNVSSGVLAVCFKLFQIGGVGGSGVIVAKHLLFLAEPYSILTFIGCLICPCTQLLKYIK